MYLMKLEASGLRQYGLVKINIKMRQRKSSVTFIKIVLNYEINDDMQGSSENPQGLARRIATEVKQNEVNQWSFENVRIIFSEEGCD